jgi:hypothetical protein
VTLDVFLVPVGESRHELYSESAHDDPVVGPDQPEGSGSWWHRQMARFRATLAEAEDARRRRDRGEPDPPPDGLWGRIMRATMRRIAETIAEQRLLWQLRKHAGARLVHPDRMSGDRALELLRASLAKDFARHRRWCAIDAILTAILGPLFFFVPGPNVISWYFFFRAIGHYLALRGARHGLAVTAWQTQPSPHLTALADALRLPRAERWPALDAIAASLGLEHLTGFVERVSIRSRPGR